MKPGGPQIFPSWGTGAKLFTRLMLHRFAAYKVKIVKSNDIQTLASSLTLFMKANWHHS
jgi:hypothetical protein